jgi:arginyl-tRNA synthetase
MDELNKLNQMRRREVETIVARELEDYQRALHPSFAGYALAALERRVAEALSAKWQRGTIEVKFELIERARYGGDISLKLPQLLKDGGPKQFIGTHLPWVLELLKGPDFAATFCKVEAKGMYINLTLSDRWLLEGAESVGGLGARFGHNDSQRGQTVVVDYSSPNVAKVLHAGHIRSTIVGHVLCNLLEANGAVVYRVNHINDFGGFGFMLEGYRRFADKFPAGLADNARLLELYRIRRTVECVLEQQKAFDAFDTDEREIVSRYFPQASSLAELTSAFASYVTESDRRFAALEAGAEAEVELWQEMVGWSLAEFGRFYDALNVHFKLVIGESFYYEAGNALVERSLREGKVVQYSAQHAEHDTALLDQRCQAGAITRAERDNGARQISKDVGAVVVPLEGGERFVIRRADGRSIYATRDLGAVQLRREIFAPTDIIYVVGQEQRVHFDRLFKSSYQIGLATPEELRFQHVYFGFYVDARTGKKLSSRESVANVTSMLEESAKYFRARLSERVEQSSEEIANAARQLAVGSIVFNDLKQDIKGAVEIDSTDIRSTIATFEDSGGAYVVYAACRARSILRRLGRAPTPAREIESFSLDDGEVELILKVLQTPQRVALAARNSNPSVLVRHLLEVATMYNSYYARAPVFVDGVGNPARLLITQAVQIALTTGLSLCHVECPEVI